MSAWDTSGRCGMQLMVPLYYFINYKQDSRHHHIFCKFGLCSKFPLAIYGPGTNAVYVVFREIFNQAIILVHSIHLTFGITNRIEILLLLSYISLFSSIHSRIYSLGSSVL